MSSARRAFEFVRDAILEDWMVKLLSLLIATSLWAWVQGNLEVEKRLRADVQYLWPAELARYEDGPSSIAIVVRGPQAQVRRVERERPTITVDLSDAPEGKTTVEFAAAPIKGIPEGLHVTQLAPATFEMRFERSFSRKVPVRVALAGEVPGGYRLLSAKASPSTVEVSGPRTMVRGLADIPTEPLDVSELRASRTVSVPLSPASSALDLEGTTTVQVSLSLEAVTAERHFEQVPVRVDDRGWRSAVDRVHVVLTGPVAELDRLDASKLEIVARVPDPAPTSKARLSALGAGPGALELTLPEDSTLKIKRLEPDSVSLERVP